MDIHQHLPALVVLIPLFGGLLSMFTFRGVMPWLWATIVAGATFAVSLMLLRAVYDSPDHLITYYMGQWPGTHGIALQVDPLNAFVIAVVAFVGAMTTFYARLPNNDEIAADRHHIFYAVWLLAITGLIGITVTGDTFNIYVLLEISSLTVYTLVAMGKSRDRRALTASLKYLILGSIGATFILLGIGYLLMLTGTLNMADMHDQLVQMKQNGNIEDNRTVLVAVAFLIVGLGIKMAMWPLHTWLPNAYTYAPSSVSALVSATATKVGVYMAFRFLFTIFGGIYDETTDLLLLTVFASAGIIFSGLRAIRQTNVKRILAFSSVGQLGYIVLGFTLINANGVTASIIHIFNHALIKGGMFMACGCVALQVGGTRLRDFQGIGKTMPLTSAAFLMGGLGLVGFPMTAGFISKWYLVAGLAEIGGGMWVCAGVVLVGSVIALVYTWRVVETMYFKAPLPGKEKVKEAPLGMVIPMWILIGASIYFGIDSTLTGELAGTAANVLLEGLGQ